MQMDGVKELTLHKTQRRLILERSELQGHHHWAMLPLENDYGFIPVTDQCSSHITSQTCRWCARPISVCDKMAWEGLNTYTTRKVITFISFDDFGSATKVSTVCYDRQSYRVKFLSSISDDKIKDSDIFRELHNSDKQVHPCDGCLCSIS